MEVQQRYYYTMKSSKNGRRVSVLRQKTGNDGYADSSVVPGTKYFSHEWIERHFLSHVCDRRLIGVWDTLPSSLCA
jgi:hypothetical protein